MIIDKLILNQLLTNSEYFTTVFPHLNSKLFDSLEHQTIFDSMSKLYTDFTKVPTVTDLELYISDAYKKQKYEDYLKELKEIKEYQSDDTNSDFMLSQTEKWIRTKKMRDAILQGADALDNNKEFGDLYEKIGDALSVTLDKDLGFSNENVDKRFELYKQVNVASITTGIETLDESLGGGFLDKTLNVVAAVTHGGKSLMLSHICAHNIREGKKGVYVTLEMSETEIWKRIDANILKVSTADLAQLNVDDVKKAYSEYTGSLYVKEYGAGSCSVNNIRAYLNDLKLEKNFVPDYLCVDYLTIMSSTRFKWGGSNTPSYLFPKFIAEELHAFSKELGIPIITAAQLNRAAFGNLNSGIQDVADSIGISQTADVFFTLNKDSDDTSFIYVNISKNRNSGILNNFSVGVDYSTLSFYDTEKGNVSNDTQKAMVSWATDNKPVELLEKENVNDIPWM